MYSPSWRSNSKWERAIPLWNKKHLVQNLHSEWHTTLPWKRHHHLHFKIPNYYLKTCGKPWHLWVVDKIAVVYLLQITQSIHSFPLFHKEHWGISILLFSVYVWIDTLQSVWRRVWNNVYELWCVEGVCATAMCECACTIWKTASHCGYFSGWYISVTLHYW